MSHNEGKHTRQDYASHFNVLTYYNEYYNKTVSHLFCHRILDKTNSKERIILRWQMVNSSALNHITLNEIRYSNYSVTISLTICFIYMIKNIFNFSNTITKKRNSNKIEFWLL